jgi:hypothetical protein
MAAAATKPIANATRIAPGAAGSASSAPAIPAARIQRPARSSGRTRCGPTVRISAVHNATRATGYVESSAWSSSRLSASGHAPTARRPETAETSTAAPIEPRAWRATARRRVTIAAPRRRIAQSASRS